MNFDIFMLPLILFLVLLKNYIVFMLSPNRQSQGGEEVSVIIITSTITLSVPNVLRPANKLPFQGRMQDYFVALHFLSASIASNSFSERTTFTDGGLGVCTCPKSCLYTTLRNKILNHFKL